MQEGIPRCHQALAIWTSWALRQAGISDVPVFTDRPVPCRLPPMPNNNDMYELSREQSQKVLASRVPPAVLLPPPRGSEVVSSAQIQLGAPQTQMQTVADAEILVVVVDPDVKRC